MKCSGVKAFLTRVKVFEFRIAFLKNGMRRHLTVNVPKSSESPGQSGHEDFAPRHGEKRT